MTNDAALVHHTIDFDHTSCLPSPSQTEVAPKVNLVQVRVEVGLPDQVKELLK